jgi:hypothetical protein
MALSPFEIGPHFAGIRRMNSEINWLECFVLA